MSRISRADRDPPVLLESTFLGKKKTKRFNGADNWRPNAENTGLSIIVYHSEGTVSIAAIVKVQDYRSLPF